jgi:hypothetical protein
MRNKNSKFKKESGFGGFQLPEVRGKKVEIVRLMYVFSLCSQTYRRMIKDLVYSQIWLNLARDNYHFSYKQKFFKKNTA